MWYPRAIHWSGRWVLHLEAVTSSLGTNCPLQINFEQVLWYASYKARQLLNYELYRAWLFSTWTSVLLVPDGAEARCVAIFRVWNLLLHFFMVPFGAFQCTWWNALRRNMCEELLSRVIRLEAFVNLGYLRLNCLICSFLCFTHFNPIFLEFCLVIPRFRIYFEKMTLKILCLCWSLISIGVSRYK